MSEVKLDTYSSSITVIRSELSYIMYHVFSHLFTSLVYCSGLYHTAASSHIVSQESLGRYYMAYTSPTNGMMLLDIINGSPFFPYSTLLLYFFPSKIYCKFSFLCSIFEFYCELVQIFSASRKMQSLKYSIYVYKFYFHINTRID